MRFLIKKKYINNFLPSILFLLVHLSSLIKIANHSLFDYVFLPLLIPITLFLFKGRKLFFPLAILYIYAAGSIFLLNSNLPFLIYCGWMFRFSLIPLFLFLYANQINKNSFISKPIQYFITFYQIYFFILATKTSLHFTNIIQPKYYGMGFPIYSYGEDSHMFGPTLAYVFLVSLFFLINKSLYQKLLFPRLFKLLTLIIFIQSLLTGSRGVIIIYLLFIINYILIYINEQFYIKRLKIRISKIVLKNLSSIILGFTIFISSVYIFIINFFPDIYFLLNWRFLRTFKLSLDPSKEISRGPIYFLLKSAFDNIQDYIFPVNKFLPTIDSGGLLLLYAGGLFLVISLVLLWVYIDIKFKSKKLSSFIVFSSLFYFILNAPHIMIPRYWIALIVPILLSI